MVKRCFTCHAYTEQKCTRCGRKCCDDHLIYGTGDVEVCITCKEEFYPQKVSMAENAASAALATAVSLLFGVFMGMEVGVHVSVALFFCVIVFCTQKSWFESKTMRLRRVQARPKTSPILDIILIVFGPPVVSLPIIWISGYLYVWISGYLYECTLKFMDSRDDAHDIGDCFVRQMSDDLVRIVSPLAQYLAGVDLTLWLKDLEEDA
jgi:hypothetical protein